MKENWCTTSLVLNTEKTNEREFILNLKLYQIPYFEFKYYKYNLKHTVIMDHNCTGYSQARTLATLFAFSLANNSAYILVRVIILPSAKKGDICTPNLLEHNKEANISAQSSFELFNLLFDKRRMTLRTPQRTKAIFHTMKCKR